MELFEAAILISDGIATALTQKKGFLVGRNGTIELESLLTYAQKGFLFQQQGLLLEKHAGVFPSNEQSHRHWVQETESAIKNTDLLIAGWFAPLAREEKPYLANLGRNQVMLPLRALEPYYVPVEMMWTRYLGFHKVAVVSSFAETAMKQIPRAKEIWGDRAEFLLPSNATFIPIRTGYAPVLANGRAEWIGNPKTWEAAVDSVVQQVIDSGAEIVLIGCGGLGMILGYRLKKLGKVCIVMGGAIQVLFGIKGNRWENHSVIGRFWNDAWVYPSEDETPAKSQSIEKSCYWR
jgi:hypothetical protein